MHRLCSAGTIERIVGLETGKILQREAMIFIEQEDACIHPRRLLVWQ